MPSTPQVQELLAQAGMSDDYDEKVARIVRDSIRKDTGRKIRESKVEPWPGTPVSTFPLVFAPTVRAMIEQGEIERVGRPKITDPSRMAYFYRFVR